MLEIDFIFKRILVDSRSDLLYLTTEINVKNNEIFLINNNDLHSLFTNFVSVTVQLCTIQN